MKNFLQNKRPQITLGAIIFVYFLIQISRI
jgi:hypothetical protein